MNQCKLARCLIFFLCWTAFFTSWSQELPYLKNYAPSDYKAARQNWSICQDAENTMFIGNDQGLLRFDGGNWKLYSLPEGKSIRSVFHKDGKIYSGAYGEFGYWEEDKQGGMVYTSLNHLIKDKGFFQEEIWHITEHDNKVYFQSFAMLFVYDGAKITRLPTPGNIMFLNVLDHDLILPVIGMGLFKWSTEGWILLQGTEVLGKHTVSGIFQRDKQMYIATIEGGVFVWHENKLTSWHHPINRTLTKAQVNKALKIRNNLWCFATINEGVLLLDAESGEVVELNTVSGLQNNTVLSLCADKAQGLWMGLDKGVSYFSLSKDIVYYDGKKDRLGTIYTAEISGKYKYLGTNQGLYRCLLTDFGEKGKVQKYTAVQQIKGQVWHLLKVEGGIICAHNAGSDLITDKEVKPLFRGTGSWFTTPVRGDSLTLIQGSYSGALIYKFDKEWKFSHRIENLGGAIDRISADDKTHYWLTGPGGELRRIVLNDQLTKVLSNKVYNGAGKLNRSRKMEMVRMGSEFFVQLKDSLFRYDPRKDNFEFQRKMAGRIVGPFGHQYFEIYRDSVVLVENNSKKSLLIRPTPEKNVISQWSDKQWLVLQEEGYVLIKNDFFKRSQSIKNHQLAIDFLQSESGTIYDIIDGRVQIPYNDKTFKIFFHEPIYSTDLYYAYELSGRDFIKGAWEQNSELHFFNLNYGKYLLTIFSSSGNSQTVSLEVLPPWYWSVGMKITYALLACMMGFGFWFYYTQSLKRSRLKLEKENERLLREHKIALDNQKLVEENRMKSQELANSTMQLIKKNELLVEIKDELVELRKSDEGLTQKEFQKMMRHINENITSEHDNKLFEANFHEIHEVFFKKLLIKYPNLTSQDLKLAAYLKMNLTTKEIAPLFNITVRGLENKRYRLRNKLGLSPETNLSEFFIGFE